VTDRDLRQLQRERVAQRWTPTVAELRGALRHGALKTPQLQLAAVLGIEAAAKALGEPVGSAFTGDKFGGFVATGPRSGRRSLCREVRSDTTVDDRQTASAERRLSLLDSDRSRVVPEGQRAASATGGARRQVRRMAGLSDRGERYCCCSSHLRVLFRGRHLHA